MKKLLVTAVAILMVSCLGQGTGSSDTNKSASPWKEVKIVDEFGDDTGKTAISALFKGHFSNSVTNNSDLTVKITKYDENYLMNLYEYGEYEVAFDKYSVGTMLVKRENGTVEKYKVMFLDEFGLIFSDNDEGKNFKDVLTNGENEEVTCVLSSSQLSKYGSESKYTFKVITN